MSAPLSARDVLRGAEEPADAAEPAAPSSPRRRFAVDGVEWIATAAGECVYGTGLLGGAPLVAIGFARTVEPERTLRLALLPRGRFFALYDAELRDLLESGHDVDAGAREDAP